MSRQGLLAVVSVLGLSVPALGQDPVQFDTRRVFACTEIKPPQQADVSRKIIVVSIPISANFRVPESSVELLRYELRMPKSITVIDHLPKTRTAADVRAQSERRLEDRQTEVRVEYGGKGQAEGKAEFNAWGARFSLGAGGGGGYERRSRDFTQVKTDIQIDRLPPMKQVIVAGTEDEGQTVYFELPWHNQATRAGYKEYAILAEVGQDWTGDVATLVCTARQDGRIVAGMTKAIGLYVNGDSVARKRVEEQAQMARLAPISIDADVLTTSIGLTLKRIPAGSFLMGAVPYDTDAMAWERPQHRVKISRPFYIGVYEVTQHEYKQVMGSDPSKFQDSDQQPVENVSWFDAVIFCNKLSEREGRKPYYRVEGRKVTILGGNGFRLPTEAEWEYACRAGSTTNFPFGDNEADLGNYAWFDANSGNKTHSVGQKRPNQFGLYDMLGNAWEWCGDWYDDKYYKTSPVVDPAGPASASSRVLRGGSCGIFPLYCLRPSYRNSSPPKDCGNDLGFRLAADQE